MRKLFTLFVLLPFMAFSATAQCTCEWVEYNGSKGMKFIGPNDGFIFLPAPGYRDGSSLFSRGSGYYWSGTPYSSYKYCAYGVFFNSNIVIPLPGPIRSPCR